MRETNWPLTGVSCNSGLSGVFWPIDQTGKRYKGFRGSGIFSSGILSVIDR